MFLLKKMIGYIAVIVILVILIILTVVLHHKKYFDSFTPPSNNPANKVGENEASIISGAAMGKFAYKSPWSDTLTVTNMGHRGCYIVTFQGATASTAPTFKYSTLGNCEGVTCTDALTNSSCIDDDQVNVSWVKRTCNNSKSRYGCIGYEGTVYENGDVEIMPEPCTSLSACKGIVGQIILAYSDDGEGLCLYYDGTTISSRTYKDCVGDLNSVFRIVRYSFNSGSSQLETDPQGPLASICARADSRRNQKNDLYLTASSSNVLQFVTTVETICWFLCPQITPEKAIASTPYSANMDMGGYIPSYTFSMHLDLFVDYFIQGTTIIETLAMRHFGFSDVGEVIHELITPGTISAINAVPHTLGGITGASPQQIMYIDESVLTNDILSFFTDTKPATCYKAIQSCIAKDVCPLSLQANIKYSYSNPAISTPTPEIDTPALYSLVFDSQIKVSYSLDLYLKDTNYNNIPYDATLRPGEKLYRYDFVEFINIWTPDPKDYSITINYLDTVIIPINMATNPPVLGDDLAPLNF